MKVLKIAVSDRAHKKGFSPPLKKQMLESLYFFNMPTRQTRHALNCRVCRVGLVVNNRLSVLGNENANAVWQAHLDYLIRNEIRVSANFLFDEFYF